MDTIDGVVIGLVTQVQPGQVKVNLPWLADDQESDWIRIATAMSGNNRGSFLMPELQDEVLVAFDQGDPRLPYIVGFLWNGQDNPPGQDVRDRRITSKNGHEVRFLDATPSQGSLGALVIEDAHGNRIVMSNGKITIQSQGLLQIDASVITMNGRIVAGGPNPI
ncbi:MAG: phage baseplate assembly protein V [Candidatus Cybelea sp.]